MKVCRLLVANTGALICWAEIQHAVRRCGSLGNVWSETKELTSGLATLYDCHVNNKKGNRLVLSGYEELTTIPDEDE